MEHCKAHIRDGWHTYSCKRPGKLDGYCGTHHPDAVKKRREKIEQRWAEESKARSERYEREAYDWLAGEYCRRLGLTKEELGG